MKTSTIKAKVFVESEKTLKLPFYGISTDMTKAICLVKVGKRVEYLKARTGEHDLVSVCHAGRIHPVDAVKMASELTPLDKEDFAAFCQVALNGILKMAGCQEGAPKK